MRSVLLSMVVLAAACDAGTPMQAGGDGGGGGNAGDGGDGGQMMMPPANCTPSCAGMMCGADGCGGTCGGCPAGQLCNGGSCGAITGDAIQVDVTSSPHAIHPEVYGLAFASKQTLTDLHVPVNRWGGNSSTRFNWMLDVHNTANDWYFENIVNNEGDPTYGTAGYVSTSDQFVLDNQASGAASLMTIPTIGWTPKDRATSGGHTCGFPIATYGAQQSTDPYDANCGNGKNAAGTALTGDPTTTSTAAPPSFEQSWLTHLTGKFGNAQAGGIRYYALDNEMMLWSSTHADVHPAPVSYDEVWKKTTDYAPIIKAADPGAFLLGYGSWGVLDLFDSGLDQTNNLMDQAAHGKVPLAEWYLQQLAAYDKANGKRLVDCLDIHYYPQGGDPLENTASLWDATYHDPSWIDGWLGEPVRLLPRVAGWIASAYPGTGMCITEYNFNLDTPTDANAALAEADALGLFGVYGVRLANFWTTPVDDKGVPQPAYYGMKIFRNYDGAGGAFGDTSVGAATTLPSVAVYAATNAAGAVTVIIINKGAAAQSPALGLHNFQPGASAKIFQHVAGGATLAAQPDLPVTGGKVTLSLPAKSITLVVVPHG